tara:strand:+ start:709 stop:927 length:219 start_codon:yes stop_codon:yes gene_type:complete
MTKFILLMLICSNIPGNDCKPISTPIKQFNNYHECIYHGYDYSSSFLRSMGSKNVDEYQMYTMFDCKENTSI